ncbi:MAG TPA: hypothetical protein VHF90_04440 [Thermoleophilaceae bacterium]|nr:hypothetical protein [Thermoleophilaceae bacterium]
MRRLVVLLFLVLPASASADATYSVTSDSVYVRPKPQSWAIGTLYRGEHMDVQEITAGGWAYGYVYGSFNGCAWVDQTYIRKSDSTVVNRCPTDDATRKPAESQMFSAWSDPAKPDGVEWHTVDCAPAGATRSAYGNYRGDFKNKYGEIPVNSGIDWRYTTKDGAAAMVKNTANAVGAPAWFFIPRACIAPGPPVPASAPPPPASQPPSATPGERARKRKVCWKTSKSRYCKKLRRTCRRHKSHSARCRRALKGKRKKRRSRAAKPAPASPPSAAAARRPRR